MIGFSRFFSLKQRRLKKALSLTVADSPPSSCKPCGGLVTQIMTRFPPARRQTWRVTRRFVSGLTSAALSAALMLHMPNALALEAGDKAPEFELPAARGGSLSL
ncbi:hypothetical protein RZS08_65805, partial [Arthrospira platensis SPKY1]|nr:hypothetical protein [Arthrospira platensis SPKY1]